MNIEDLQTRYNEALEAWNKNDYNNAFKIWSECGNFGHSDSLYGIGMCYELGLGVERSEKLSQKYYKLALKNGSIAAKGKIKDEPSFVDKFFKILSRGCLLLFLLFIIFCLTVCAAIVCENSENSEQKANNTAQTQNVVKLQPAPQPVYVSPQDRMIAQARNGTSYDKYNLGVAYVTGNGIVGLDKLKGYVWLYRSAEEGNNQAFITLRNYLFIELVDILINEAITKKNADGLMKIGLYYYFGIGVQQDQQKAIQLIMRAAEIDPALAIVVTTIVAIVEAAPGAQQNINQFRMIAEQEFNVLVQNLKLSDMKSTMLQIGCDFNL